MATQTRDSGSQPHNGQGGALANSVAHPHRLTARRRAGFAVIVATSSGREGGSGEAMGGRSKGQEHFEDQKGRAPQERTVRQQGQTSLTVAPLGGTGQVLRVQECPFRTESIVASSHRTSPFMSTKRIGERGGSVCKIAPYRFSAMFQLPWAKPA